MSKPQQTAWKTAVVEEEQVLVDEGDVFTPLKRVRQRYYDTANQLLERHTDEEGYIKPEHIMAAENLRSAGDRVGLLIPKEEVCVEPNPTTEPVETAVDDGGSNDTQPAVGEPTESGGPVSADLGQQQDSTEPSVPDNQGTSVLAG